MGSIRLYGSTSGYLELQAPAVAPDAVLTLPSDSVQPGLVHIHTETFSGQSSVSINNCFSSNYSDYLVLLSGNATSAANVDYRLRASGTNETGANYVRRYITSGSAGTSMLQSVLTGSQGTLAANTSNGSFASATYFHSPFAAQPTYSGTYGYVEYLLLDTIRHTLNVSYDGFTAYLSSGTMTGSLRIYGYRNA